MIVVVERDCLRRRQSPGESKSDTARSPPLSNPGVCLEPECVVIDDVSPPPTEQARPQIKVGDYVSVHSRGMGSGIFMVGITSTVQRVF